MAHTFVFISWSEKKAYILLSLLRNAGATIKEAAIPKYIEHKDGTRTPYKSVVEAECPKWQWEEAMTEMYERWARCPESEHE